MKTRSVVLERIKNMAAARRLTKVIPAKMKNVATKIAAARLKRTGKVKLKNLVIGFTVALLAVALVFTLTSGVAVSSKSLKSSGSIFVAKADLGLYSDSAGTQGLTSIDWGTLTPGGTVTRTVYVKNIGNTQVTLSMSAANWYPATANGPLALTWNREGTVLPVGQIIAATLILSVSSSATSITTFGVDIVIAGSG